MKNIIFLALLLVGCNQSNNQPVQEHLTTYYIEVKYVDNTKDTLVYKFGSYPDFGLYTNENARGGCLCAGWDKLACDVKTYKIIKHETTK